MILVTEYTEQELEITAFNRDEQFASRYLGVAIETLRGYRKRNRGPEFRRIGGKLIRYSLASLRAWSDAQPRGGGIPQGNAA
jgi:hypothetical protein